MAKLKTYKEILRFFDGVGLYFVPIPIAESPLTPSAFPYLMIDNEYFSFRGSPDDEGEIFDEDWQAYCDWANHRLKLSGKNNIRVVFHRGSVRLIKDELVEQCPAN